MKKQLTRKDWLDTIEKRFSNSSVEFHDAAKRVAEFWKTHSDEETKKLFVEESQKLKLTNWMAGAFADLITCYKNL